jgi:glutamate synthase domain-containing protein 2
MCAIAYLQYYRCPTGVATQDPKLYRGLVVADKYIRVKSFQHKTVHATVDIIASAGLQHTADLNRTHIFRRVSERSVLRYDEVFRICKLGCYWQKSSRNIFNYL